MQHKAFALFNGVVFGGSGGAEEGQKTEHPVVGTGTLAAANGKRGGESAAGRDLCRRGELVFAHDLREMRDVFQQRCAMLLGMRWKRWLKSKPLTLLGET